ncbi:hypothetical protein ABEX25_13520 [Paenibacillus thiaminolyticus]|uniref:hypothetical protein n=1 Tax=Paenibacillus thiaminolyticus TaxID=49283 RepID=UPI003D2C21DC
MRARIYGRIPAKVQHFTCFSFVSGDQGRNSCIFAGLIFDRKQLWRNNADLQYFRLSIIRRFVEQYALNAERMGNFAGQGTGARRGEVEACGIAATTKRYLEETPEEGHKKRHQGLKGPIAP